MICIYLCDDDDAMRGQIQKILERKILIEEYDMRIVLSVSSAGPLLEAVRRERGKRGVYFLDGRCGCGGFRSGGRFLRCVWQGSFRWRP